MKEQLFLFFYGPWNSNVSSLKVPEIKTCHAQSHVLVTSNVDDDSHHQSKMTKLHVAWRHHIPIIRESGWGGGGGGVPKNC